MALPAAQSFVLALDLDIRPSPLTLSSCRCELSRALSMPTQIFGKEERSARARQGPSSTLGLPLALLRTS